MRNLNDLVEPPPAGTPRDVAWTILAQSSLLLLGMLNAALVARWLGPEGKGTVALALLLPEMLTLALSGGIEAANVYLSSTGRFRVAELAAASTALSLIAAAVAFSSFVVVSGMGLLPLLLPGPGRSWLGLAMLVVFPAILTGHLTGILRGVGALSSVNAIRLVQSLLQLCLTAICLAAWPKGVAGALLATVLGSFIGALLAARELGRRGARFRPSLEQGVIRALLSYGVRGHIGNLCQFLNYRLDVLVVNYFVGATGLGLYTAAVRVAETLLQVPNAVAFVAFPAAASGQPNARGFASRILPLSVGATAAGAVALALAGPWLIRVVYTSTFADSYAPLLALLPGMVLLGAVKVLAAEVAGRGYPHYNSAVSALGLPVTMTLALVLVPRYGLLGAASATSLSYACALAATLVARALVRRRTAHQASAAATR